MPRKKANKSIEYEVEAILEDKVEKKKQKNGNYEYFPKYRVKWLGYPISESTWEPLENLSGCRKILQEYLDKKQKMAQLPNHMINRKTKRNEFDNEVEYENIEDINSQKNSSKIDNLSTISNENKNQLSNLIKTNKKEIKKSFSVTKSSSTAEKKITQKKRGKGRPKGSVKKKKGKKNNEIKNINNDEILILDEDENSNDENNKKIENCEEISPEFIDLMQKLVKKRPDNTHCYKGLSDKEKNKQKINNNEIKNSNSNEHIDYNSISNLLYESEINCLNENENIKKEEKEEKNFQEEKKEENKMRIFAISNLKIPKNKNEKFMAKVMYVEDDVMKDEMMDLFCGKISTDTVIEFLRDTLTDIKGGETIIHTMIVGQ